MYCPSCGTEYTIELKYCNRCGANLGSGIEQQPHIVPVNVTKPAIVIGAIMIILTVVGFGMLIGGAIELSRSARIDPDSIGAMVGIGILSILTIDIFLVRQLSKLISAALSSGTQTQPKRPNLLSNPSMVQLPQPSTTRLQGVSSVTEGTTRFFEAYRSPAETDDRTTAEKLER